MEKRSKYISILTACLLVITVAVMTGCVDDPVPPDYYNDIDRIKGGEKPDPPPVLDSISVDPLTGDGYPVIIYFSTGAVVDPEPGGNASLSYFFYASTSDPGNFDDPSDYYDEYYYIGYTTEAEMGPDPKDVTVYVSPDFSGEIWFWITAYDGGRESDHSNVDSVIIP